MSDTLRGITISLLQHPLITFYILFVSRQNCQYMQTRRNVMMTLESVWENNMRDLIACRQPRLSYLSGSWGLERLQTVTVITCLSKINWVFAIQIGNRQSKQAAHLLYRHKQLDSCIALSFLEWLCLVAECLTSTYGTLSPLDKLNWDKDLLPLFSRGREDHKQ